VKKKKKKETKVNHSPAAVSPQFHQHASPSIRPALSAKKKINFDKQKSGPKLAATTKEK